MFKKQPNKRSFRVLVLNHIKDKRLPQTLPKYAATRIIPSETNAFQSFIENISVSKPMRINKKGRKKFLMTTSLFSTNAEPKGGPAGITKPIIAAPIMKFEPMISATPAIIRAPISIATI